MTSPVEWMRAGNWTVREIAKELKLSHSNVQRPLSCSTYPTFTILVGFYRLSGGEVTLADWITLFRQAEANGIRPPYRGAPPQLAGALTTRRNGHGDEAKKEQNGRRRTAGVTRD